jgi:hypothetical protein
MTISEAIKDLEKIKEIHGDLPVAWDNDGLTCAENAELFVTGEDCNYPITPYSDEERDFLAGRRCVQIFSPGRGVERNPDFT